MEDSKSGLGWIGVLFVILVIWAIFGGGFGNGNGWGNNRQNGPIVLDGNGWGANNTCNRVSNCEIERREIIDSAETRFLVEQQGAQTRAEVQAGVSSLYDQANRIYIQNLQTDMFDLKMENQTLKSQIYSDAQFNALSNQLSSCCCNFNSRLDGIESQMLTKPTLSGVAATTFGQLVPTTAYGGYWGNWNNGGCCNGNI